MSTEFFGSASDARVAAYTGSIPPSQEEQVLHTTDAPDGLVYLAHGTPGDENSVGAATTVDDVITMRDRYGNAAAALVHMEARCNGAATLSEVGAGAEVSGTGTNRLEFNTSAAGAATIRITDADDEQVTVRYRVLGHGAADTPPHPRQGWLDMVGDKRPTFIP